MEKITKSQFDNAVQVIDQYHNQIQNRVKECHGSKTDIYHWWKSNKIDLGERLQNLLFPGLRGRGMESRDNWPFDYVEDITKEEFLGLRNAGKKSWIELKDYLERYQTPKMKREKSFNQVADLTHDNGAGATMTAAVISHNLFDVLYQRCQGGAMETYNWIGNLAIKFEQNHAHVQEWEKFLYEEKNDNYSDWEEYLIAWVNVETAK